MAYLEKHIYNKNWSKEDKLKTLEIIRNAHALRSETSKKISEMMYWIILVITLIINIVVSFSLIPLLLALKGLFLYVSILLIAIGFGYFFEVLLRDIEKLEKKHHLIFSLIIPTIALINFYFIVNYSNNLETILRIDNVHNPFVVGTAYIAGFLVPYFYFQVLKK